jgi:hypothetical protein
MDQRLDSDDSLVISYLWLRTAIGIIGIALPFVLALGKILFDGGGLQSSMSAYYYTNSRNFFVGSLCAIGVFLMSYRGYERKDNIAGKLACLFAIGVAFFPTQPETNALPGDKLLGAIHLTCAALLFLTLAYFSLCLFRKTDPTTPPTPQKLRRNAVYSICGYTILASILFIVIFKATLEHTVLQNFKPVFWLEALAVVSFGVSWLTKGEAILGDEK